jgi:alkyl sulfatase BDS1-like metallo-beta-lactamase superfamily hydrolase
MFAQITGPVRDIVPTAEVAPDLFVDEQSTFTLGGRRFEIHWTPGGETRSALIVWLPEEKIAIVGNLFGPLFGNQPNLNTIRGDKPRSALEFIASIKKLRALAPELVLTGHEEIRGAAEIEHKVTRVIDSVQWIHDRTVEGMNAGVDLRTLMREVKPPPELTLTEEYGRVAWNVRAIWHEYTGWFDPDRGTTDLYGVPLSSIAPAISELAGGADRLAERARGFVKDGGPLEALHLLDLALAAEPRSELARQAKREALELLLQQCGGTNLWERMWIASELRALEGSPAKEAPGRGGG